MQRIRSVPLGPVLTVVGFWSLAVVGRVVKAGAVYGLDFSLFQPDGVRYQALTLQLLGNDLAAIGRLLQPFYALHALHSEVADIGTTELSSAIGIAWSRPLYSVLSVPFVSAFGQWGMLVIPALSLLGIGLVMVAMGRHFQSPWIGAAAFAWLSLSPTVLRWMVLNCTDALALFLGFLLALLLLRDSAGWLICGVALLTLSARPVGPALIAMLLPHALAGSGAKRLWLWTTAGLATLVTVVFLVVWPDLAVYSADGTTERGLVGQLLALPKHLLSVPAVEFGQLAVMDRLLLLFLGVATVVAARTWRDTWSASALLTFAAVLGMGIWMGALGANFRLQLPVLAPLALVLVRWFGNLTQKFNPVFIR